MPQCPSLAPPRATFHLSKEGFLIQAKKDANIQAKKAENFIKQQSKFHMAFITMRRNKVMTRVPAFFLFSLDRSSVFSLHRFSCGVKSAAADVTHRAHFYVPLRRLKVLILKFF